MKTINHHFSFFCRTLAVLLLFFCVLQPANGQKVKTYKIWVALLDGTKVKGALYAVNEEQLVVVGEDLKRTQLDPKEIKVIKFRRAGSIGRGAWIGAIAGLFAGAIVSVAVDDSGWDWGYAAAGGGVVGLPVGAVIGMGIGSVKKKFVINGDENAYRLHLSMLQKYAPQTGPKPMESGTASPK